MAIRLICQRCHGELCEGPHDGIVLEGATQFEVIHCPDCLITYRYDSLRWSPAPQNAIDSFVARFGYKYVKCENPRDSYEVWWERHDSVGDTFQKSQDEVSDRELDFWHFYLETARAVAVPEPAAQQCAGCEQPEMYGSLGKNTQTGHFKDGKFTMWCAKVYPPERRDNYADENSPRRTDVI